MTNQSLIIKDWQNGIAGSPHLGHALIQNLEIDTFPGAMRVGKKAISSFPTAISSTIVVSASTDVITLANGLPTAYQVIQFTTTGTLPAGLSLATNYWISAIASNTFKVATTAANATAGTFVDITDAGTGVHTATSINPGVINYYAYDPRTGWKYCLDSNGRLWIRYIGYFVLLVGNTLTNSAGNGLALFRTSDGNATYLFVYRNAVIDVINVFGTTNVETPVWSSAWQSLNSGAGSGNNHHSIVGQDNIIYFTDDRYVGSIQEKPGSVFDPSNSGTYTFQNKALTLPLGSLTYWLEQLGINLLVSVSNDSYVYPWDRSSVSYGLPLPIADFGINKMKNIGNVVYILAGTHGNIYWTQGTYVKLLTTLPIYLTYNATAPVSNPVTWGGIAAVLGKLFVGVGALSGNSGVYSLNVTSGATGVTANALTIDNYPSTGAANVTALFAVNEFYDMGYSGGADTMDTSRYVTLGIVLYQSQFYRVGTKTTKQKFSQIEIQIANGVTGSIRCSYRRDLSSAFTNIPDANGNTTTFVTDTSHTSYQLDCGIIDLENIQVQIELSGNIDLMEVRLNP